MVSLYAAFRYDYSLVSKHSFFYDLKVGPTVVDPGVWSSMGFGLRFGNAGKIAYNLGLRLNFSYIVGEVDAILAEPMVCFGIDF